MAEMPVPMEETKTANVLGVSMKEKVLVSQSVGFVVIIALSWLDECVGLRSLVLGDHPYISDFKEASLEMLFVLVVWFLVYGSTQRMLGRLRHVEGFMHVCGWCRRVRCEHQWIPMEQFLLSNFQTTTSHGICEECRHKQEAVINGNPAFQFKAIAAQQGPRTAPAMR